MALFPYQRLAYLYDVIRSETLPQTELANRFHVSTRTIRSDVIMLNDILNQYGAQIDYKKKKGYQLLITDPIKYKAIPIERYQLKELPRSSKERVLDLLIHFLTHLKAVKLDELADRWFISRSSIQNDLSEVKEYLEKYGLSLNKKPHQGMKLIGDESGVRACLTNILWQAYATEDNRTMTRLQHRVLNDIDLNYLEKILQNQFERFDLQLSAEGQRCLLYNCAISIARITMGQELIDYQADNLNSNIIAAGAEIAEGFAYFLGFALSESEFHYLCVQIASRSKNNALVISDAMKENSRRLVKHILDYINQHYNYDMRHDRILKKDLFEHVSSMLSRISYQIHTSNPLLNEIKQYYPFAYDITVSAVNNTEEYTKFKLTEDNISYLTVHIGVALERNYNVENERHSQALLVSDLGNSTLKMIESKVKRDFPQVNIARTLSYREYGQLKSIYEDFIITTVRLAEKDKPIVKIAPFPTPYQLEQLGRLVMIDRTMPYVLERFFDERFFMVINKPITRETLFKKVSKKLQEEGYVNEEFYASLIERESIVSTLLGENIAIPHTVGLLAKKTMVTTILAPEGIIWDGNKNEVANVIFLLAISKDEYEDAMSIYNLFVNFVKEKSTKRLLNSQSFREFQAIVKDSFGRIG